MSVEDGEEFEKEGVTVMVVKLVISVVSDGKDDVVEVTGAEEFPKGGAAIGVDAGVSEVRAGDKCVGTVEGPEVSDDVGELTVMGSSGTRSVVDEEDASVVVVIAGELVLSLLLPLEKDVIDEEDATVSVALWMGGSLYTFRRSGPPQNSDWLVRQGILQPVASDSPNRIVALLKSLPHQHSARISDSFN